MESGDITEDVLGLGNLVLVEMSATVSWEQERTMCSWSIVHVYPKMAAILPVYQVCHLWRLYFSQQDFAYWQECLYGNVILFVWLLVIQLSHCMLCKNSEQSQYILVGNLRRRSFFSSQKTALASFYVKKERKFDHKFWNIFGSFWYVC